MIQNVTDIQRRLTQVVEQQQQLLNGFNEALAKADTAEQAVIQKQLHRLSSEMQRLTDDLRYAQNETHAVSARPRARATGKTLRELVLDILDEIGVPLAPSTISEFSQATTGIDPGASRFASLRRDEERAARRDIHARPAWIVPALNTARLNQVSRLLTSSAWSLDRRLLGARSLRVIHLHTTLAFLARFERMQAASAPQASAIESLLLRYARGVPGALMTGEATNPKTIRNVIEAELAVIEAADVAERAQAAARLSRYADQQKLWGLPTVIDGGAHSERAGA
ncbi:MAG: hypothetical protein JNN22_04995 [Rhodospirillales bacterium]|nr:hypothetical protein [Rhodospirillales bacterium]